MGITVSRLLRFGLAFVAAFGLAGHSVGAAGRGQLAGTLGELWETVLETPYGGGPCYDLGGMVAPLAASRSVDVSFLILIAPPGVTLGEAEAWDDEFNLRKQGFPDDVIARSNEINAQLNEYLRTGRGRAEIETALQNARREKWFAQTDLPENAPSSRATSAYGGLDFDLNPLPVFQKVRVPVLVIFGELDNRIPPQKSVAQIEQALKSGGNNDFDIKIFPGADHSIRLPNGKRADTGGKWDWARVAPGYMETVLDWSQKRVGLSQK
jgi:pimeloyl-ACP methyl ester carboxylesterase